MEVACQILRSSVGQRAHKTREFLRLRSSLSSQNQIHDGPFVLANCFLNGHYAKRSRCSFSAKPHHIVLGLRRVFTSLHFANSRPNTYLTMCASWSLCFWAYVVRSPAAVLHSASGQCFPVRCVRAVIVSSSRARGIQCKSQQLSGKTASNTMITFQ